MSTMATMRNANMVLLTQMISSLMHGEAKILRRLLGNEVDNSQITRSSKKSHQPKISHISLSLKNVTVTSLSFCYINKKTKL